MDGFEFREYKTEIEAEELFHAVAESLKSEEPSDTVVTKPEIVSSEDYTFQKPDDGEEYSTVITQLNKDIPLPLLCRLCTIPNNNMTDIFGFDATSKNILLKINHCLSVTVEETDTLPKRVCWSCLEELDRCYRFHETVAEAEKQLLALASLASRNLEEMKKNSETFSQCDREDGWIEPDNIDETTYNNDTSMCSPEKSEESSSNSKRHDPDLTTEAFDLAKTISYGIVQQTTYDSKVTGSTRCSSVADEVQGNGAEYEFDEALHTGERQHRCTICTKIFNRKTALTRHYKIHAEVRENYSCDLCSKVFMTKPGLYRHLESHSGPGILYKCDLCPKTFISERGRSEHLKFHSSLRELYRCGSCSKVFTTKRGLSAHLRSHSGPREFYNCDSCSAVFESRAGLYRHTKFHTGTGLFSCEYCGKQFSEKWERNRHHLVHTGERPFNCSKCEKSYTNSSGLKKHTAMVHSGKLNHPCSVCDESFKTFDDRNSHMLVHVDKGEVILWQCDHCMKFFKRKHHLVKHVRNCKERYSRSENKQGSLYNYTVGI